MIRYKKIALILFSMFLLCLSACKIEIPGLNDNNVNEENETDYSIGITNVSNSNVSESFPIHQPVINHKITTEKSCYNYNEELKINVDLALDYFDKDFLIDGDFCIKINESEYYEVVGKNEYVIEDIKSDKYYARDDNLYPINLKFIIKPIKQSFKVSYIKFLMKFNYPSSFRTKWEEMGYSNSIFYNPFGFEFEDEYFYIINTMFFVNDSENMKLSLNAYNLVKDGLLKDYNKGIIDKQTYVTGLVDSFSGGRVFIQRYGNYIEYFSSNLKFRVEFLNQSGESYSTLSKLIINEHKYTEAAEILFEILKNNSNISNELYEMEIQNIYSKHLFDKLNSVSFYQLIPFDDYEHYMFDYVCVVE